MERFEKEFTIADTVSNAVEEILIIQLEGNYGDKK